MANNLFGNYHRKKNAVDFNSNENDSTDSKKQKNSHRSSIELEPFFLSGYGGRDVASRLASLLRAGKGHIRAVDATATERHVVPVEHTAKSVPTRCSVSHIFAFDFTRMMQWAVGANKRPLNTAKHK